MAELEAAGIRVVVGERADEAARVVEDFIVHRTRGRPLVVVKFAASLDGRIAAVGGDSRWVSGPTARAWVHRQRAVLDAIMVGSGTVLTDDPLLSARPDEPPRADAEPLVDRLHPAVRRGHSGEPPRVDAPPRTAGTGGDRRGHPDRGEPLTADAAPPAGRPAAASLTEQTNQAARVEAEMAGRTETAWPRHLSFAEPLRQPLRVVVDSRGRIPVTARVLGPGGPTLIATTAASPAAWRTAVTARGAEMVVVAADPSGRVDPAVLLGELGRRGVMSVLVEGGATLLGSLFDAGLVDKVHAVIAPVIIGGPAPAAVRGRGALRMADARRLRDVIVERLGDDVLITGYPHLDEG